MLSLFITYTFVLIVGIVGETGIGRVVSGTTVEVAPSCAAPVADWWKNTSYVGVCVIGFYARSAMVVTEAILSLRYAKLYNLWIINSHITANSTFLFRGVKVLRSLVLSGLGLHDDFMLPDVSRMSIDSNIDLSNNSFTSVPQSICQLKGICFFDMSYNRLTVLPNCPAFRANSRMYLSHNSIHTIPPSFFSFGNVVCFMGPKQPGRVYDISYNRITSLVLSAQELVADRIDISYNNISSIVRQDGADAILAGVVKHFDISYNRLRTFRSYGLTSAYLDLSFNDLGDVNTAYGGSSTIRTIGNVISTIVLSANNILSSSVLADCQSIEFDRMTASEALDYVLSILGMCYSISIRSSAIAIPIDRLPISTGYSEDRHYKFQSLYLDDSIIDFTSKFSLKIVIDRGIDVLTMVRCGIMMEISALLGDMSLDDISTLTLVNLDNNAIYGMMNTTILVNKPSTSITLRNNRLSCIGLAKWCAFVPLSRGTGECFPCITKCGDGLRSGAEECDDGNNVDGDCCSSSCLVERMCDCTESAQREDLLYISENPSTCVRDVPKKTADLLPVLLVVLSPVALFVVLAYCYWKYIKPLEQ